MKTLLLLISVTLYAQDPKTYYQQLPTRKMPETIQARTAAFQESLAVADQIEKKLTKAQMRELLPLIFAVVKADDPTNTNNGVIGLYAASKRPDSGELFKPYMQEIAALLNSSHPGRKATAGSLLMNMHPQPPEAAEMLLQMIRAPLDPKDPLAINKKIDALTALTRLQNPPQKETEAVAIDILNQPMPDHTMAAAINAAITMKPSDMMIDAFAEKLSHPNWQVRFQAINALRGFPAAIARHRGTLARLASDPKEPEPIRVLAQNAIDGKDNPCLTLQASPTPQLVPIPGCKPN